MVFGSRGRTPRTSVGWGGGSSGHEPGKSCCQFREKQSEDRFSEEIQWAEWLMYCWERGIQERETKIWETDFFSPCQSWRQSQKYSSHPRDFFFSCSSEYLQVTFLQVHSIPSIQSFSVLRSIFVSSRKNKNEIAHFVEVLVISPDGSPWSSEAITVAS